MTLEKILIPRVALLGAFAFGAFALVTKLTADQTPMPALVVVITGKGEHALAIVNPLTNKVVGSVPIVGDGGHPHEVAVSADGKLAFVTNTNYAHLEPLEAAEGVPAAFLSVIDLAARKELHRVEIGLESTPHGVVFAGSKVFFTDEGYRLIERYDPASNKIDWVFGTGQTGTHMLVANKAMTKIFASNLISDSVIAIEPWDHRDLAHPYPHASAHPWMETVIPVGDEPEGIAMSPDEKEVWTLNKGGGSVSIIDVASKRVSQTLKLNTKLPLRIKFTPDGKRVVIIGGEPGEVLVLDAVTRKEIKKIMNVGGTLHGLVIASDNSKAYVTVRSDKNVAVIDLKTLEISGRISTGARVEGIAWAESR